MRVKNLGMILIIGMFAMPALGFTFASSPEYEEKVEHAEHDYEAALKSCDALSGNKKDICVAQAKAEEIRIKADAKADEIDTPKARNNALIKRSEADLRVAREKCSALEGNAEDVCIKRAELTYQENVSIIKANQKVRDAQQEALDDIGQADYELSLEKCNALSGAAKDSCIETVNATYNK